MDRLCSMLLGCESIRDVIAFPKNKKFQSLVDGAPTKVEEPSSPSFSCSAWPTRTRRTKPFFHFLSYLFTISFEE